MSRPPDPPRYRQPDGIYSEHTAWAPDGSLLVTIGASPVPDRCPYKVGDWVQMHGYPGLPNGPRQRGFRGVVLGSRGATLLTGITDDGRPWDEYWGALVPDGTPCPERRCTCCPRPRRQPGVQVEQLDLFGALLGAPA